MPDIFGRSFWSYYDSFALIDRHNWLGITGALIPLRDLQDRALWMAGWPVPVKAAFGEIAVLPMATVRYQRLRWDGAHGCEHWKFCLDVSVAGRVLACPQVMPLVIHDQPRRWSEGYPQRRRDELKRLWIQARLSINQGTRLVSKLQSSLGLRPANAHHGVAGRGERCCTRLCVLPPIPSATLGSNARRAMWIFPLLLQGVQHAVRHA